MILCVILILCGIFAWAIIDNRTLACWALIGCFAGAILSYAFANQEEKEHD